MGTLGQGSGHGGSGSGLTKVSSGLVPAWDTPEWVQADEDNYTGYQLVESGEVDQGMALLSRSARFGFGWALATYTWLCLKSGDYARGISEYDACIQACERLTTQLQAHSDLAGVALQQLANVRSNAALLRLASGGPLDQARATWEAGAPTGHAESQFYPAIVAEKQGNPAEADQLVMALSPAVWFDVRQTLREGIAEGGWFGQWCTDGLVVLERTTPTVGEVAIPEVDLDRAKALPRASAMELSEGLWEAVDLAIALDPAGEEQLRVFADGGDATSWLARSELGCLLSDPDYSAAKMEEGTWLLNLCLHAPFADVVATSAWNLAELSGLQGKHAEESRLAAIAVELGDGTAMRTTADRLHAEGQDREALDLYARAVAELPRGDLNRMQARAILAREAGVGIPSPWAEWFSARQGCIAADTWSSQVTLAMWAGEYNVDGGYAAISTRYFEACPAQCHRESTPRACGDCGRDNRTFLQAASGRGDGNYNAFALFGETESGDAGQVGVFLPFLDEDIDGLSYVGKGSQFLDIVGSAAPVILGTLVCHGELIMADSAKSRDDDEISVRLEMPAGEYVVVCWLRPEEDSPGLKVAVSQGLSVAGADPLTSVALMAVSGPLAQAVTDSVPPMEAGARHELLEALWGDEDRLVYSLMADIRPQILARMIDADGGLQAQESFLLQAAERNRDGEDAVFALRNANQVASADTLNLLAQRGFLEPELRWWHAACADDPDDIWQAVVRARSEMTFPGSGLATQNVWARRALARRAGIPTDAAQALSRDEDDRVRRNIAANEAAGASLLAEMASDSDPAVRSAVASNPRAPQSALRELAQRPNSPKFALAQNPQTPMDVLTGLAGDTTSAVLAVIAARPDLPGPLAELLVSGPLSVQGPLASNPATPPSVLTALSTDGSEWVRSCVAGNPTSPVEVLTGLSLDPDEDVRDAIMANPSASEQAKAQAALLGAPAPTPESAPTTAAIHPISVLTRARFCPNCGTALQAQHKFCGGCGAPAPEPAQTNVDAGAWAALQSSWEIRGNFNVEGGSAGVGTRIFEPCDCEGDVEVGTYCGECGRGPGNYVAITSGAGDGVYPIFRLLDEHGARTGAVALFEAAWAQGVEDESRSPAQLIASAKPVFAGMLTVGDLVYASDASSGWDSSHAMVDVELPAATYEVIAWQAEMDVLIEMGIEPTTRQIALGLYSPELVVALEAVLPIDRREESRTGMQSRNSGAHQVLAHVVPRWADACMYNAREDDERGEYDRATSWLLQAAKFGDVAAANTLPPNFLESMAPLDMARRARLLALRGQRSAREDTVVTSAPEDAAQHALTGGTGLSKQSPGLAGSRSALNDIERATAELQALDRSAWHEDEHDPDLVAGLVYYDAGDWEAAQPALWRAASRGNITACFKLANSISRTVDDDAAMPLWRLASDHGHAGAINNVALRLIDQGRRAEALHLYRTAAEAGLTDAMFNLATHLEDDGDPESRTWLRRAIEAGHARACTLLGYNLIEEGDLNQGWDLLEEGAARGNLSACLMAGSLLFNSERYQEAEAWLARGFTMTEDLNEQHQVPRLWALMGVTLTMLERYEEAIPYLERALELGETDAEASLAAARSMVSSNSSRNFGLTKSADKLNPR
jgi:tetratricopeptide (TPR) repeat protein